MIDRTEFERIIDGLKLPQTYSREELIEKCHPLYQVIHKNTPEKLFRYRMCSLKNVEAFNCDDVYAVTTDMFNDPYDGLVKYNTDGLKQFFAMMTNPKKFVVYQNMVKSGSIVPDNVKPYLKYLPQSFVEDVITNVLSVKQGEQLDEKLRSLYKSFEAFIETQLPFYATLSKQYSTVACFSETIRSVTMWSHYADYHKGFALEYDVRECLWKPESSTIFLPVIYDDKRIDATDFLLWQYIKSMNMNIPNPDMLSHIRCLIHKSRQWEYEQEWRMIDTTKNLSDSGSRITKVKLKPNAIYYGNSISQNDKSFLHDIAIKKGIAEYEMYMDFTSDIYEMKYKKI